jgi:hypothetical protein
MLCANPLMDYVRRPCRLRAACRQDDSAGETALRWAVDQAGINIELVYQETTMSYRIRLD